MKCRVQFSLREGILLFFFILFHFLKHLPFIEDKPTLKKLQTEKQALEDAGETDEKDEDEVIDKVKRKNRISLCRVPFQNYQIVVIRVGYQKR